MDRPRRVCSPPLEYDPRVTGRPPPDYDDQYVHMPSFEPTQSAPAFIEPHPHYQISNREHRLPSSYRINSREQYPMTDSPTYKILCITNINPKVGDGPVKEALTSDFSRFGDISVTICHDSGERLAYIYFRSYEEAREARHVKARTILFDRPIEIEPIYDPRDSPVGSPPPPLQVYTRRRSITPDYYESGGVIPPGHPESSRRLHPTMHPQRGISPFEYHHARYSAGPGPPVPPYDRYYMPPSQIPPPSPYSSPPPEPYRSYPHPPPHPSHFPPHNYHPYGPPPMTRDREGYVSKSPRHDPYYPIDHRHGPPPQALPPRNTPSGLSHHMYQDLSPPTHHAPSSSARRSPPHVEHTRYISRELRREKFNEPEEGRPSRVLFVTNIDCSKKERDLRDIFDAFGSIEDIEIKKINSEISSALIKFSSMDCAYRAKTAINGRYIGSTKCRITYGKVNASRRLWIGGLGSTTTLARLEDEFGRFGSIIHVDYTSGRPYAYIEYESANQAQFATQHLRGTLVAQAERKIRIEYVDPIERVEKPYKSDQTIETSSRARATNDTWGANEFVTSPKASKRSISPIEVNTKRVANNLEPAQHTTKYDSNNRNDTPGRSVSGSLPALSSDHSSINSNAETSNNHETRNLIADEGDTHPYSIKISSEGTSDNQLESSRSIKEILSCCTISWNGQLGLRNFSFPAVMSLCSGRKDIIESYITKLDPPISEEGPLLHITQRWRLHPQPKLEEVKRRMQSGNLGMIILTPKQLQAELASKTASSSSVETTDQNGDDSKTPVDSRTDNSDGMPTQSRPLKNLISYLEQKDAAGVISLNALDQDQQSDSSKLLYAFPPCDFALNLLKRKFPHLGAGCLKEEFLLGVIVGNSEAKI